MSQHDLDMPIGSDELPAHAGAGMHVPRGKSKRTVRTAAKTAKSVRKRPPLYVQDDAVLERVIPLALEIKSLVDLQKANGGTLPYGELKKASERLAPFRHELLRLRQTADDDTELADSDEPVGSDVALLKPMHKNGVGFLMKHFVNYHSTYEGRDPAEAFSPFLKAGRPSERTLPSDVSDFMKRLWKKRGFLSKNYDGSTVYVDYVLHAKEIVNITKQTFPNVAAILKLADVYHAREDVEKADPVGIALARQGVGALLAEVPEQGSNVEGIFEQLQSDIRSLPIYSKWKGIICTVRILYIIDRKSTLILGWKLVPGKDENLKREVVGRDFVAREFRELLAWVIKHWGMRPRQLYVDNGTQYKTETLGPFMRLLDIPGERSTALDHTPRGDPKGRGATEGLLGDVDRFLRARPAFFEKGTEGDFSYRAVLDRIKKGEVIPREFEDLAKDIKEHINVTNTERETGPSRINLFNSGVKLGLSVPSKEKLFLFARRVANKPVKVQPYGIWYNNKKWEPEDIKDEAVRAQWLRAAMSPDQRHMMSAQLGDELLVYVNLSGDLVNYEPFIEHGKPRLSVRANKLANKQLITNQQVENQTSDEVIESLISGSLGQRLVLDGSRKKAVPAQQAPVAEEDLVPPPPSGVADWARPPSPTAETPADAPNPTPSQTQPVPPPDEDDDWSFFTGLKSQGSE